MPNNSATGGPLVPLAPPPSSNPVPLMGEALNDFFQELIVGITGLPGDMVRVAFQTEPPNAPSNGTAWCAFRADIKSSPTFAYVRHVPDQPDENGSDEMQRDERIDLVCSFYDTGVNGLAYTYAILLRDGFAIAQNREPLQRNSMGFVDVNEPVPLPSLIKTLWKYRVDITVVIQRRIVRRYPVYNILSAEADIHANDAGNRVIEQTVIVQQGD